MQGAQHNRTKIAHFGLHAKCDSLRKTNIIYDPEHPVLPVRDGNGSIMLSQYSSSDFPFQQMCSVMTTDSHVFAKAPTKMSLGIYGTTQNHFHTFSFIYLTVIEQFCKTD